jgi:hypothetical protein
MSERALLSRSLHILVTEDNEINQVGIVIYINGLSLLETHLASYFVSYPTHRWKLEI